MRFLREKGFLRFIAFFFLVSFLNLIIFPTVSLALTAGPTAPEYSSFEPVDTSDLVNLATGDLVYNLPLIEIPGPEGGYPLGLSYHSGIQPDLEASWVGLGWTLNPGALNRTVNGYPDDFNSVRRTVRSYWVGGETNTYSMGVGYAGANFGLTFANDTYEGFGVGFNAGVGFKKGNSGVGVNLDVGPYGGATLGVGFQAGFKVGQGADAATGLGVSAGIATNFHTVAPSFGVGLVHSGVSVLKLNMSTASNKTSLSVAGLTSQENNNNAGKISSYSHGFSMVVPTPTPLYFTLGYNYRRYWSDENDFVTAYGSVNFGKNIYSPLGTMKPSLDSYSLFDPTVPDPINSEPDKQKGGSFAAYDSYLVTGQGVGGSIQPYILDNTHLYRQQVVEPKATSNGTDYINHVYYGYTNQKVGDVKFRFKYDFSNSFSMDVPAYPSYVAGGLLTVANENRYFDPAGFNTANNHLAGSRHIEHFTNFEINQGTAYGKGFITYESDYAQRSLNKYDINDPQNVKDQIGGFMITNESGVTYHYSLPVYAYKEYSRTESEDGKTFRESFHEQPYAYTWLLTGVTGPDYVDRGNYGFSDEDYGYWVKFDYGKYSDSYNWRNPDKDWHKDIDNRQKFYSSGRKELYYLDAVKTRSHTAVFVKSVRTDGKGVSSLVSGGSKPAAVPMNTVGIDQTLVSRTYVSGDQNYYDFPVSTLKLDNIILVNNDDYNQVMLENITSTNIDLLKNYGNKGVVSLNYSTTFNDCSVLTTCTTKTVNKTVTIPEYLDNVIDNSDATVITALRNKALRVIDFGFAQELCKSTVNSFTYTITNKIPVSSADQAKLTLKTLSFKGKGAQTILPPMAFAYGTGAKNPDYNKNLRDIWGMYKSDYTDLGNENLSRMVTATSSANVDAWSLQEITSTTGSKIRFQFESDAYSKSVLYNSSYLNIASLTPLTGGQVEIKFHQSAINLSSYLSTATKLRLNAVLGYPFDADEIYKSGDIKSYKSYTPVFLDYNDTELPIVSITTNSVVVSNLDMFNKLKELKPAADYNFIDQVGDPGTLKIKNYQLPKTLAGDLGFSSSVENKGGGTRVKAVEVYSANENRSFLTNYSYNNNGVSSGVTSFEPVGVDRTIITYPADSYFSEGEDGPFDPTKNATVERVYRNKLLGKMSPLLLNAREVPAPGVIYEKVTVTESVKDVAANTTKVLPGSKVFTFSVFEMEGSKPHFERQAVDNPSDNSMRTITMRDFSARVGNLKSIEIYNSTNQKIQETKNLYLHDLVATNSDFMTSLRTNYSNQGKVDQLFHEYRVVNAERSNMFLYSKKEEYPLVLVRQENTYSNGVKTTSENLAFDFFSGQPKKVKTGDSFGNYFITEITPAYRQYPAMGLKVITSTNKHMLTQESASKTYEITSSSDLTPVGLVSASMQTWTNQIPVSGVGVQASIWRPYNSYVWTGDLGTPVQENGTYTYSTFTSDNFTALNYGTSQPAASNWQKITEVKMYDPFSAILQKTDLYNRPSSILKSPDGKKVIAVADNSSIAEVAFSGAEFYTTSINQEGGVAANDGVMATSFAHTGKGSLRIDPGKTGMVFTLKGTDIRTTQKYRASVWVYLPGESESDLNSINLYYKIGTTVVNTNPVAANKARSWFLINVDITPNGTNNIEIGVTNTSPDRAIYADDFRVHPIAGGLKSFIYNNHGETDAILNADNFYTRFEYDNAGNLKKTYQEIFYVTEKKISEQWLNNGLK